MYHTLVNAVSRIHPDVSFSPALMTWNDVIDWLNREGADGIILEKGIPFADRVLTMRFPTAVFAGDMNQFVQQYHVMVERLLLNVPKTLVPPHENESEESYGKGERKTIKIPFPLEPGAAPEVDTKGDMPDDDGTERETVQPDESGHEDVQIEEGVDQEAPAERQADSFIQETAEPDEETLEMQQAEQTEQKTEQPKRTLAAVRGLAGFGEGLAKAFQERRLEKKEAVEYQAIPHRIVLYSPKGGAGVTSSVLALAKISGAGVLEIAYPYGQMAGVLGVNPEWTLYDTPDGREQSAVYRNQFLFSPWVYPIHERWDKETVRSWLQKGLRAFPDRMILVDLYAKAPLPILAEVLAWATRVVWMLQDTDTDLGMADIQMRNLKKMMEVDPYKWSFVVQTVHGKTLPWEDILEIPLLAKLPEMNRTSEWEKAWRQVFHQLIAWGRSLRLLEPKEG
jgi:hypothetical protein